MSLRIESSLTMQGGFAFVGAYPAYKEGTGRHAKELDHDQGNPDRSRSQRRRGGSY